MSKIITVQYKFVFESVEAVPVPVSWLTLKVKKGQNKYWKKNIESLYIYFI